MAGSSLLRHRLLGISFVASVALHLGFVFGIKALPISNEHQTHFVEMQVVRPPPPEPEKVALKEEPVEPKKEPPKKKQRPRVVKKVKKVKKPEAPKPPPPNTSALPKPQDVDKPPPEIVAGLTSDSFADGPGASGPTFGAGNTLMAKPPEKMVKPEDVQPYSAPVDLADVTSEPRLVGRPEVTDVFGGDYPAEAKARGVEGITRVKILIDEKGNVVKVRAIRGPDILRGPAEELAKRFRYNPATLNGKPVSVWWYEEIPFRITD